MKKVSKVQYYTSGADNETAHLIISKEFLPILGLSREERVVEVELVGGQLVIKKALDQSKSAKNRRIV